MSDDQTRPLDPEAPVPAARATVPAGEPVYAPRPRFADQVMGMRAVVATSLACLIVGGAGGFVLGRASGDDHGRFGGPGGGFFQQRGTFPNGPGTGQLPNSPFPNGSTPGTRDGTPPQHFDGSNPNRN